MILKDKAQLETHKAQLATAIELGQDRPGTIAKGETLLANIQHTIDFWTAQLELVQWGIQAANNSPLAIVGANDPFLQRMQEHTGYKFDPNLPAGRHTRRGDNRINTGHGGTRRRSIW